MEQGRPRDKERSLLGELSELERRDRPAGVAEEHEVSAWPQAVEALFESVLAHRVIDDLDSRAVREPLHLCGKVSFGVKDHLVRAGLLGELSLLLGRDRAEDRRSQS